MDEHSYRMNDLNHPGNVHSQPLRACQSVDRLGDSLGFVPARD